MDMDRVNSARWGPRAVDVDVLMYDDLVLENGEKERERVRPHQWMEWNEFSVAAAAGPVCC